MDGRLQAPYPSFKLPRRGHFFAARSAKKRRVFARPAILATVLALFALGNAVIQPYGLKLSIGKNQVESMVPGAYGTRVSEFVRWTSFSPVNAGTRDLSTPQVWCPSSATPSSVIRAAGDGDRRLGRHEHVPL